MKCDFSYVGSFRKCIATGTALAIGAGVSAASAAGQMVSAGKMNQKGIRENRRMREWQEQMQNKQRAWELTTWNLQNEYNSPEAQRQRMVAAGYSPLAVINGSQDVGAAQQIGDAPMPNGEAPQFANPVAGSMGALQDVSSSFLDYLRMKNETQHQLNENRKTDNDIEYQNFRKNVEGELAKGQITLWGVQCEVGDENIKHSQKERELMAANIAKAYQDVEQSKAYVNYLGVQGDWITWQKYASEKKLPKELDVLGAQAMELKARKAESWRRQRIMDYDRERQELYNNKYMRANMHNDYVRQYYETKQMEGGTYSSTGYSVLRGVRITGETLGLLGQAIRGYGMWMQARSVHQNMMMQRSSANPTSSLGRNYFMNFEP